MKITIFNLKGGVGKTTLSLHLAFTFDFFVVYNEEHNFIGQLLPHRRTKYIDFREALPNVPDDINLIYDFGGQADVRVIEAVRLSDWVIVPIRYDADKGGPLEMQSSIKTIRELEQYTRKILIVITDTKKDDYLIARRVLEVEIKGIKHPIIEIKNTNAFKRMIEEKKSIIDMCKENVLLRKGGYRKLLPQLEILHKQLGLVR